MDDEGASKLLQNVEPAMFCIAVGAVFLSIQISAYPILYFLLWVFAGGVVFGYVFFRMVPLVPNILFHLRIPQTKVERVQPDTRGCSLCGRVQCERHDKDNDSFPWDGLTVPQAVDSALTEFLEIVLKKFIYSWQRHLLSDECLVDEVRILIRHALASLLGRAQKLHITTLLTSKLLRVAAAHMHICVEARRMLPADADTVAIQEAILKHYGSGLHVALRGSTGKQRYFRHLSGSLLPFLLPKDAVRSKVVISFIEELFAYKVLGPAMQTVSNPDFIDLIILKICDPNSQLRPTFGPCSRQVSFLGQFAARKSAVPLPLTLRAEQVITTPSYFQPFAHFMELKGRNHTLAAYQAINVLRKDITSVDVSSNEVATSLMSQVLNLYDTHINPCASRRAIFDEDLSMEMADVLFGVDSDATKLNRILSLNLLTRLFECIHKDIEEVHCPQFHQSSQFYDIFLKNKEEEEEEGEEKWKLHRPILSKWSHIGSDLDPLNPDLPPTDSVDGSSDGEEELVEKPQDIKMSVEQTDAQIHRVLSVEQTDAQIHRVQVVDWKCHEAKALKPYITYTIETTVGDQVTTVIRRFREFEGLDTRLRQFYGNIGVSLPRKSLRNNMDVAFIKSRGSELESYLQHLLTIPKVQSSSLLHIFLTSNSDASLFMPDSVTGKMIKAMDLTKEKPVYIEDFLRSFQGTTAFPPRQSCAQDIAKVTKRAEENANRVQEYQQAISNDLLVRPQQQGDGNSLCTAGPQDSLILGGVMDFIVYMAAHVYNVTRWQLLSLFCFKYLFQNTLQSYVHHFVEYKVSLMKSEAEVINLICLLRDQLFPEKPRPARSSSEVQKRKTDALTALLRFPPEIFVELVGVDRFKDGTSILFEALQCNEVNKQLLFSLLDVIVLELFHELADDSESAAH